ncbi:hypothetical protein OS175_09830 [Marinicella sp. S1101]|uniref:CorA family divalent cation transporter n=1 Tax=Marinicella marina TaxID=2996016 RepID=UPI002260D995|nr:CorA family divalent cation transporter [Marinicella marina]MCX7554177.1 hypothetical protein [Marinicella marina]MDJ1141130.1 CorA family divalent cation transporter [Marinicella marina]
MKNSNISELFLDGLGGVSNVVEPSQSVVIWHHIRLNDKTSRNWIKKQSDMSEHAKVMLINNENRPRAHVSDEEISLCLRGINFNQEAQPEDMISIRLWFNDKHIVTSSNEGSQSIKSIKSDLSNKLGPKSPEHFILNMIEKLAGLTDDFVDKMDEKIDLMEDSIEHSKLNEFSPQMSQMRRQIANIRRYLLPQKEAIDKLYRQKSKLLSESFYDQVYLYSDKFIQLIENLDMMRERALMLQEHFMANISHQQNSRLYLLAIISAIFLPLTFLSGLFGMNVGGMPGIEDAAAFWYVIAFSLALTMALLVWFKKSRWF